MNTQTCIQYWYLILPCMFINSNFSKFQDRSFNCEVYLWVFFLDSSWKLLNNCLRKFTKIRAMCWWLQCGWIFQGTASVPCKGWLDAEVSVWRRLGETTSGNKLIGLLFTFSRAASVGHWRLCWCKYTFSRCHIIHVISFWSCKQVKEVQANFVHLMVLYK